MTPQRIIIGFWLAAIAIVIWSNQKNEAGVFPPAYRVGGAAVTYTFLLVLAAIPGAGGLASTFAAAWTLGLAWRTANTSAAPSSFAPPHTTAAQRAPAHPKEVATSGVRP